MTERGDFGFYGILTDPLVGYEALAAIMVERRIRYIQLRIKHRPVEEIRETARRVRRVVAGSPGTDTARSPVSAGDPSAS